jgi:hypothetical protein
MLFPVAAAETDGWFLLGRHGECAPLSVLVRKDPELRDLKSPYQFIDKMHAVGHQTAVKEHGTGQGTAVQVDVPSRGLYLMFVKQGVCADK